MAETISFDSTELTSIAGEFTAAAGLASDVVTEMTSVKTAFTAAYEGLATEVVVGAYDKLIEHLNFIGECCNAAAAFVNGSNEELSGADTSSANAITGNGDEG